MGKATMRPSPTHAVEHEPAEASPELRVRWRLQPEDLHARGAGEKDAKLAKTLGKLQPFIAVFPQECMG